MELEIDQQQLWLRSLRPGSIVYIGGFPKRSTGIDIVAAVTSSTIHTWSGRCFSIDDFGFEADSIELLWIDNPQLYLHEILTLTGWVPHAH